MLRHIRLLSDCRGYSNAKGNIVTEDKAPILVYFPDIYALSGYHWAKEYNSTSNTSGFTACRFITVASSPYIVAFITAPATLNIISVFDGTLQNSYYFENIAGNVVHFSLFGKQSLVPV